MSAVMVSMGIVYITEFVVCIAAEHGFKSKTGHPTMHVSMVVLYNMNFKKTTIIIIIIIIIIN